MAGAFRIPPRLEAAASIASGAIAEPLAGLAGIAGGGDADKVRSTREALTYAPRTDAGKQDLAGIGNLIGQLKDAVMASPVGAAVNAYGNFADKAGQMHPALGAAADTLPTALMSLIGHGGSAARSVAVDAGRFMAPKVGQVIEGYATKTGIVLPMLPPSEYAALVDKARRGEKLSIGERLALQNHTSDCMGQLDDAIHPPSPPPPQIPKQ